MLLCGGLMIAVHVLTFVLLSSKTSPVVLAVSHAGLVMVCWYFLLMMTNRLDRWHQSISALFGTSIILNLISLPLFLSSVQAEQTALDTKPSLAGITIVIIWCWDIAVTSRIIRFTLEVRTVIAIGISLALSIVIRFVLINIFGPAG